MYLSMPEGEISTTEIVRQAFVLGKKIFVPYIHNCSKSTRLHPYMEMFALRSQDDFESLQPDAWGIPTLDNASLPGRENALGGFGPPAEDELRNRGNFEGLHLILLPGTAFDHSGGRLGHGKGFYDRFLQNYWETTSRINTHAKMPHLGMAST